MEVKKHRVLELEKKIAELETRLPRHSVPPSMLQLEELEEELAKLLAQEMRSGKKQGDE